MRTDELNQFETYYYSHYVVTAIRLTLGVVIVFLVSYGITSALTASVAAIGATYVAFIDRPAPVWWRTREMLVGALLGALGVSLTGFALQTPWLLAVTMVGLAFFFSMLVVYGARGATIGLACMTLAIITIPSGLTPNKVLGYSLVSVAGALGYIAYSLLSGKLLQLREERQCLSVALYATAQYLKSRAHMYQADVDIDQGYRAMIATQAQMITAHQGARDAILGHMSPQSVGKSRVRRMVWNVMIDMSALVDLVISTHTDYKLLHQKLPKSRILELMRHALAGLSTELQMIMVDVANLKHRDRAQQADTVLQDLQEEIQALNGKGFAVAEPQAYATCVQIHRRLCSMRDIVDRMADQVKMPAKIQVLRPTFLDQSLSALMSTQSFSPMLLMSNLTPNSSAFRYALRVSLAMALAMVAGMYLPDTRAHGYWVALTVVVIMKPAYSLSKERNSNRLVGTLAGCALTFVLLHVTTDPDILWGAFSFALLMCFVLFVTNNYRIYSMFVSITVLLALHAVLPHSAGLPTERAIDTILGSIIALICSFVLPWWESKSLPAVCASAIKANEKLLLATINLLTQPEASNQSAELDWATARHDMQIAFTNFAQGFSRMMVEPPSRQVHVAQYSNLVIVLHVMGAEIVNAIEQVKATPQVRQSIVQALKTIEISLQAPGAALTPDPSLLDLPEPLPDWAYGIKQLRQSTQELLETSQQLGMVSQRQAS